VQRHKHLVAKIGKVKVLNADFLSEAVSPGAHYHIVSALNFLHYLTPRQAILALTKFASALKDEDARLYIGMNAPSPHKAVRDFYFDELERGVDYPGHVSMHWDSRGAPGQPPITVASNIEHNPDDSLFEPSLQELISREQTGNSLRLVSKKAFFYGDTASMERMCGEAGLSIIEMYYEASSGERFEELTSELANMYGDYGIQLCVIAKKNTSTAAPVDATKA
jgi:hypothetical protein